jgi:membrane protease YdiL (CAAX protease family)
MRPNDHFPRLLVILGLVIGGMLLTALVSIFFLFIAGIPVADMMNINKEGMEHMSSAVVRILIAIQHICLFILPALVFGLVYYRRLFFRGFNLNVNPGWTLATLGIFFLLAAYPLVNLSFHLNDAMPLPAWAGELENEAAETLEKILEMNSPLIFILNLLIISILPGIGEELIFRGIVQKHVGGFLQSPVVAIWISALIFSAIHMQFEGFLPRVALGAALGYLYYWTNNLWVPIIAHAFNNGIQVVLIYAAGMDVASFEQEGIDQIPWWLIVLSVGGMYFIYHLIIKNRDTLEQA